MVKNLSTVKNVIKRQVNAQSVVSSYPKIKKINLQESEGAYRNIGSELKQRIERDGIGRGKGKVKGRESNMNNLVFDYHK